MSDTTPGAPGDGNEENLMDQQRRLGDRYEVGELLGRGGMAEVHSGRDLRLGRTVAIKSLRVDLARDPSFQNRFRREAQSAASLNHPNIVAIYDTGEEVVDSAGGLSVPYLVMESVEGTTLRSLLASGRRLVPERALEITAGVLDALDYSHRHGIVHRDIKPANVMLTTAGEIKVMDFGIARAVADPASTMTQTGATLGTAQYLSPEQAQGGAIDPRSDIYSTGCMLYELLTGRPPFTGDSPVSVAYQHVRENPVPPSQIDEGVPVAVDAIVMKALAKNPDNRYQTALEMREDIDRALGGRPVTATPVMDETRAMATVAPATVVPPDKPSRARRIGFVILGLAVAAAIIGGLIALLGFGGGGATVNVPDLTGQTVTQAQATLTSKNLVLGTTTTQASTQAAGRILSQDPSPNASVKENTKINIVISQGPPQTTVPSLSGLTLDAAVTTLSQSKLVLGSRTFKASDQPENTIIGQTPGVGKSVAQGSAVNVVVSSGEVKVPSVLNEVQAQAEADLKNAGFKVTVINQIDATDTAGTVVAQNPQGGVTAKQGSIVTITVAVAPPTPTPTATPTPTLTPTGSLTPTP